VSVTRLRPERFEFLFGVKTLDGQRNIVLDDSLDSTTGEEAKCCQLFYCI